jgi:hypothetical protein
MSDPNPSSSPLQQSLSQLHAELARTPRVDDASKQLLRDVLGDIERLLHPGGVREAGAVSAADAMRAVPALPAGSVRASAASQSRLEALAVEFEADHPGLAASLRQFVDLLGRAGL